MAENTVPLNVLLNKTSEFKDKNGQTHTLFPIDLSDLIDIERQYGSIDNLSTLKKVEDIIYLVWLSTRKDGLTEEQIDKEQWNTIPRQVGRWFKGNDIMTLMKLISEIMKISGLSPEVKGGVPDAEKTLAEKDVQSKKSRQ